MSVVLQRVQDVLARGGRKEVAPLARAWNLPPTGASKITNTGMVSRSSSLEVVMRNMDDQLIFVATSSLRAAADNGLAKAWTTLLGCIW